MKINPLSDRVLILPDVAETVSPGGILIPATAVPERPVTGVVQGVGRGRVTDSGRRIEPSVKVGDRVIYGKFAGQEVDLNEGKGVILREDEILGVVE